MAQTEFTLTPATPAKLEGELHSIQQDPVDPAGLSVYSTGSGALVIYARELDNDETSEVQAVLDAHVPDDAIVTGLPADQVLMPSIDSPSTYNLANDFTARGSSGVLDGTLTYVSVGSTAVKISVAAGEGYIRTTNDQQGELVKCSWVAAPDLYTFSAPAAGQENVIFIGIEYSGGVASAVTKAAFSDWNWYSNFPLARCSYDGTDMWILNAYAHSEDTANLAHKFNRLIHPFSRESSPEGTGGLIITSSGRNLAMSAGNIWHGFNRYVISALSSGVAFDTYYRRAGGGFNKTAGVTSWPNTQYDDGSGTLATMTASRYGALWVYLNVADGSLDVLYGSSNATSVQLAQADPSPSVPDHLSYHGRLVARIIYQKSAASASLLESAWAPGYMPEPGNYQIADSTLTALAALDATTGLMAQTGADAFTKLSALQATGYVAEMIGASAIDDGGKGLVPTPSAGDQAKFLMGDGTWLNVNSFSSINCPAGTSPAAETSFDTLNLTASGALSITGNATTDTVAFAHLTTDGNIHLPSGGNANRILKNSGTAGTAAWGGVEESSGALSNVTTLAMSAVLTSTQATGAAPFVVSSTTVCSNLNVDMVDGKHGTELQPLATHLIAGNQTITNGTCFYVTRYLEIQAGTIVTIGADADIEIG